MLYLFIDKQVFMQRVFLFFFLRAAYVVLSASTREHSSMKSRHNWEICLGVCKMRNLLVDADWGGGYRADRIGKEQAKAKAVQSLS